MEDIGGVLLVHSLDTRFPKPTVKQMTEAEPWMFQHHARTGVTHHDFDLFATVALVAVDGTFGACRLFLAKPAAIQPHIRVIQKTLAFRTECGRRSVLIATIEFHHRLHCYPFTAQPLAGERDNLRRTTAGGVSQTGFSGHIHADSFAFNTAVAFDAGQRLRQFLTGKEMCIY